MNSDGNGSKVSQVENKTYIYEEASPSYNGSSGQPHSAAEGFVVGKAVNEQESVVDQPKRAAKIHDFCFGIPFGQLISWTWHFWLVYLIQKSCKLFQCYKIVDIESQRYVALIRLL